MTNATRPGAIRTKYSERSMRFGQNLVRLTQLECRLVDILLAKYPEILTRAAGMQAVFHDRVVKNETKSLNVLVCGLRDRAPGFIQTLPRKGWRVTPGAVIDGRRYSSPS